MAKASSLGQAEIFMKEAIQMMKGTDMVKWDGSMVQSTKENG